MINTQLRLTFQDVFPDEEEKDVLEYLKEISSFTLLNIIGFCNTSPQPNFDNFSSDAEIQNDIIERVIKYSKENNIREKPVVVSREGSLRLAEIILSNRKELIVENTNDNKNKDELNLLKAFLIINKEVNAKQNLGEATDNIEKMADMMIAMSFSTSDIGIYSDNNLEFAKLLYATIVRFELLVEFLQSDADYKYLENDLVKYFNQASTGELSKEVKFLFAKLLEMKAANGFKFKIDDKNSLEFIFSLTSNIIIEDDDFTNLRNYPIYQLEDNVFSIIDYFFVVDKFYRSVKFILKSSFHNFHNLPPRDRTFFNFFNTEFSENFLMNNVLDKIFMKKYFVKKAIKQSAQREPDYYVRHNNRVFLFENKDVLIAKQIRSSGDIEKIDKVLKSKFLNVGGKDIGIGQLVNSIVQIVNNEFEYDDYVNSKANITIYPILLVSDRIFEILGINYRLNQWYLELVKERLGDKYNSNFIKNLTFIDIDTLIYWLPGLVKNDNVFRKVLDDHLKKMNTKGKVNHRDFEQGKIIANKNFTKQLAPISARFSEYKFPIKSLTQKFEELIID
jgi:hypothetical protein